MFEIVRCTEFNDEKITVISRLAEEIWNGHYIPIIGKAQIDYMLKKFQSPEGIKKQFEEGFSYYLLKKGYNYIGYFALKSEATSVLLSKFYIKAEYRGHGYGRQVIKFIEDRAVINNWHSVNLLVHKNNTIAINSYKKFGFNITEPVITDIGEGYFMDDYRMEKSLVYSSCSK